MPLPVDTTKLTILCGAPPLAVVERETGAHRTNREGQSLFRAEVIVMGCGRPQVLGVRTAKEPKALGLGAPVNLTGLDRLDVHGQGRGHRRVLRGRRHRAGQGHQGGLVRRLLRFGVAFAFVLVVIGETFEALAIVGTLALLDRLERRP